MSNALTALSRLDSETAAELLVRTSLDGRRRPETLDVAEFVRLADQIGGYVARGIAPDGGAEASGGAPAR